MVRSYLKMVMNIKANLLMVNFKGPEDLNRINMSIMDNLKMDSMMGKVNIYGCRDQFMMVNMRKERNMVMEFIRKQTVVVMKGVGLKANAMEKDIK